MSGWADVFCSECSIHIAKYHYCLSAWSSTLSSTQADPHPLPPSPHGSPHGLVSSLCVSILFHHFEKNPPPTMPLIEMASYLLFHVSPDDVCQKYSLLRMACCKKARQGSLEHLYSEQEWGYRFLRLYSVGTSMGDFHHPWMFLVWKWNVVICPTPFHPCNHTLYSLTELIWRYSI